MIKIKIPKIDKQIFKKSNIILAYLFGSQAKGKAASGSDFDLAVLFKKSPSDPLALKEIASFSVEIDKLFPAKLDIVSLNDAPLLLKYEVVAYGKTVYSEDEKKRIAFEVSVIKKYIDEEPVRKLYDRALYKRILQAS
jgi:predicted nucleotidyltransferase